MSENGALKALEEKLAFNLGWAKYFRNDAAKYQAEVDAKTASAEEYEKAAADIRVAIEQLTGPPEPVEATVEVPGQMLAFYRDGHIDKWVFMPHGGSAGYFGPSAVLVEGDENLDVADNEGDFWIAVSDSLAESKGNFRVVWDAG